MTQALVWKWLLWPGKVGGNVSGLMIGTGMKKNEEILSVQVFS